LISKHSPREPWVLMIGVSHMDYAFKVGKTNLQGLGFTTLYAGIFSKGLFGWSIADIIAM
jgi:hypothetical protein